MNLVVRRFFALLLLIVFSTATAQAQPKPASPAAAVSSAKVSSDADAKVGFDVLGGFPFTPPAYDPAKPDDPVGPRVDEQIPAAIKNLNNRKVTVTGYMLPTRMEGGQVLEFLLLRDQTMCCFGAQPQMNEWIVVRMEKSGMYLPDIPKSFSGVLKVGAIVENGYMSGIYLLEAAKAAK